jgi:hypothetical protein
MVAVHQNVEEFNRTTIDLKWLDIQDQKQRLHVSSVMQFTEQIKNFERKNYPPGFHGASKKTS